MATTNRRDRALRRALDLDDPAKDCSPERLRLLNVAIDTHRVSPAANAALDAQLLERLRLLRRVGVADRDTHAARCAELAASEWAAGADSDLARSALMVLAPKELWYALHRCEASDHDPQVADDLPKLHERATALVIAWQKSLDVVDHLADVGVRSAGQLDHVLDAAATVESELRIQAALVVRMWRCQRELVEASSAKEKKEIRTQFIAELARTLMELNLMSGSDVATLIVESRTWRWPPCPRLSDRTPEAMWRVIERALDDWPDDD